MAKKSAAAQALVPQAIKLAKPEAAAMEFKLDAPREAELRKKLQAAVEYHKRAFGVDLSVADIYAIMKGAIERDKERLFLKNIGNISEADVLWFKANILEVQDEAQSSSDERQNRGSESPEEEGNS